jgi:hypothetical protein
MAVGSECRWRMPRAKTNSAEIARFIGDRYGLTLALRDEVKRLGTPGVGVVDFMK